MREMIPLEGTISYKSIQCFKRNHGPIPKNNIYALVEEDILNKNEYLPLIMNRS